MKNKILKEKIKYLEKIISLLPGNVFWKNKDGIYLGCNLTQAKALGFNSTDELIGKTDYELVWKKQANRLRKIDIQVMESGKSFSIEEKVTLASGQQATYFSQKLPLTNDEGKIEGIIGIAVDITKLKQLGQELRTAKKAAEVSSQAKSEFIANMSHDIRTPITGISGLMQEFIEHANNALVSSLQTRAPNREIESKDSTLFHQLAETVREDGQHILNSLNELLQLLNEILETIRLESGKVLERVKSFNLRELIAHNVKIMLPIALNKKLKLQCEMDELLPTYVQGLYHYLDRTLLNLLSNALKFTPSGFVKVRVQLLDKAQTTLQLGKDIRILIAVEDSGIGIPEDKFETIFEHFARLTPSYQGIYKGSGLGLYTVKHYIEAMHAKIKVESEVGKGARFTIIVPLIVADYVDYSKESFYFPQTDKIDNNQYDIHVEHKTKVTTHADILILVVEDNQLAARAVRSLLTRLNCISDHAANGQQALKSIQEKDYDVIFMDIGLPDIDGIELTQQIRSLNNPKTSQIPIIALTGHANNPQKREEAFAAGIQEIYSKPLQLASVETIFQNYVFKKWAKYQESRELIDWNACLQQCNGDEVMVRELLWMLANDLKMSQNSLKKAYVDHDNDALRAELHRVRGGVAYLKLPKLSQALAHFHNVVKENPQDFVRLEQTYNQLQKAIEAFFRYINKSIPKN